ncbi:MAG: hypothetical protein NVS9B4_00860 [Candidatus Acidiferrum sp.]
MSTISELFGTKTNLTITAATLAASATVGRQATVVDNTVNNALDVLVQGTLTVGVVSGNKQILFYVAGSFDGGTTYSLANGTNTIGATDAAFTRVDPSGKAPSGVLPVPTASIAYSFDFSVAQSFGGSMPQKWALCVFNDSGVALTAFSAWYIEIRASIV